MPTILDSTIPTSAPGPDGAAGVIQGAPVSLVLICKSVAVQRYCYLTVEIINFSHIAQYTEGSVIIRLILDS